MYRNFQLIKKIENQVIFLSINTLMLFSFIGIAFYKEKKYFLNQTESGAGGFGRTGVK